jgi:hypothetical protein
MTMFGTHLARGPLTAPRTQDRLADVGTAYVP